ncbi:MAG: hypothetical protein IT176_09245 [Acidobacteria bacterium]|nr:hypothetical protein [Acidobacteriota bacterium]
MPSLDQLNAQLDRLASLEPGPFPVVSLYLNMRPGQNGRDTFGPFLRKELAERIGTFPSGSPERAGLEADARRIRDYVDTQVEPSADGLAIFACAGARLFDAVQFTAPIPAHRLYISPQPHLYPLARLIDEYPRYAVLLADTHRARIFVVAINRIERAETIQGVKTKRHRMGGTAQARYQRHVENYHLQHAKEVADALDAIVRTEAIQSVIVTGDEVIVPLLEEQFSSEVSSRLVEVLKLSINAPEREVLEASIEAMKKKDAAGDRERVGELLDAYRGSGLGCIGVTQVRRAFELGQVDELIIAASPDAIDPEAIGGTPAASGSGNGAAASARERIADELVAQARKTSAKIRFIEDAALLGPMGGVGAFLRFRV